MERQIVAANAISDYILETPDHAQRLERARELGQLVSGLLIFLEGHESAAEALYRFADDAVQVWP